MTTFEIIKLLNDFVPFAEDDPEFDNESFFYKIMEDLQNNSDFELAFEPIFNILEKYPLVDFGSPGPIVHTLESFQGLYEYYLFDSLKRRPTPLTVWMFNRIINAEQNAIIKENLITRLESFLSHTLIEKETIEAITGFVEYQKKKI